MRVRYQRPEVKDLGNKWKLWYWDYSSVARRRRSRSWSKNAVPARRDAQRLADQFMKSINEHNNDPTFCQAAEDTYGALVRMCGEKTWPHLKNSTRQSYDFFNATYLLPIWGRAPLSKIRTVQLQDYFNSFSPRLSPKTIRLMHGCMRATINQGKAWGLIDRNPAVGVKLPRKKARKPPVLLEKRDMQRFLRALPEPSRSICTLIACGSLRPGEILALRWKRVLRDRIQVVERIYEGEFDEVKTEAGVRDVPLDRQGHMRAVLQRTLNSSRFRGADDLVFCNRNGGPLNRRNLLRRQLKPTARRLGLPGSIDFRGFRTMHASLMLRNGTRPEVVRDNMGQANIDTTQNIYGKTWWRERVEAVSRTSDSILGKSSAVRRSKVPQPRSGGRQRKYATTARNGHPFGNPKSMPDVANLKNIGRGERI